MGWFYVCYCNLHISWHRRAQILINPWASRVDVQDFLLWHGDCQMEGATSFPLLNLLFLHFSLFICLDSIEMRRGSVPSSQCKALFTSSHSLLPVQGIIHKEVSIAIIQFSTSKTTSFDWVFAWHSHTEQENTMVCKPLVWVYHLVSRGHWASDCSWQFSW